MTPFDFLNSINNKNHIDWSEEVEKQYNSFMVNRGLSYFPDTVFLANEVNRFPGMTSKMQYDFLNGIVKKKKRFSKWHKFQPDSDVNLVASYFGYSYKKAREVVNSGILNEEDYDFIKRSLEKGGK